MDLETLLYEVKDRVATITINRPEKRNTLSPQVIDEILACLGEADTDADVGAVVITGAGEKAFCAGADLAGSMMAGDGVYGRHEAARKFLKIFKLLEEYGKPVIAAANGHCLGGGLGLALACDMVIAVEDAKLGTPEIKLGLFPHVIMATIFRNVSNPKKAWEMVLTGSRLSAKEAMDIGMVNTVVPRSEFAETVESTARKLAGWSPAAMRLGRRAYYAMRDMTMGQALDYLHTVLTVNTMTEDAAEGITAFFQKREPQWKGK